MLVLVGYSATRLGWSANRGGGGSGMLGYLGLGAIAMQVVASLSLSQLSSRLVSSRLVLNEFNSPYISGLSILPCHHLHADGTLIDQPVHCLPATNSTPIPIPCRSCQLSSVCGNFTSSLPPSPEPHPSIPTQYRSTPANPLTYPPEIPGLAALRLRFPGTPIRLHH
jgi:hypothetical protein